MTNSQTNNTEPAAVSNRLLVVRFLFITLLLTVNCSLLTESFGQAIIPKPKTKAEKKAERKNMTLEQKIESFVPVDVTLPGAKLKLPGDNNISSVEDAKKFVSETLPDLGLKVKRKTKKAKELAKQAVEVFNGKEYDGIAVDKHVVRRGSGNNMRYTELYTSRKNDQEVSPYIRDIYWFEEKRERVVPALARDRQTNALMHGPYKAYKGETLLEEGDYYLGTKHGRWVTYDGNGDVLSKFTYNKGFLAESDITYYGIDSTKIKEVIPNWYGKKTGDYFIFNESGTLAVQGQLDNGKPIGKWVEYYPTGNRRKKETQYGSDFYDETKPFVIREYDEGGKMTYQNK